MEVMSQCRDGNLQFENYFFMHGAPTLSAGSTIGGQPTCGNSQCAELTEKWKTRFMEGISTEELKKLNEDDCQIC